MHMLKQTFTNFVSEHKTLSYVLIGMIMLPVTMAVVLGLISLVTWLLSFVFGTAIAILIIFFALIGAIIGYFIANAGEKEHADYY